jgi:glycosyltransferase involved in cell wall biosynthesis
MKALVCAPLLPEYDREGGSRRIFHLIEFLLGWGWEVAFAAENGSQGERYARLLEQRGVITFRSFGSEFEALITDSHVDIAILAFWHIGELLLPMLRSLSPSTKVIVDSIDLHFLRNARERFQASNYGLPGALDQNYAQELARELNVYGSADAVFAVSEKEARLLADLMGEPGRAQVIPLMEDLPASGRAFPERKGVLFVGNFRHPPNIDALEYLCQEILPCVDQQILKEHPLYVVGNDLQNHLELIPQDAQWIVPVGWVPSLAPYYDRVRASLIPLRYGAGTKTKLIQAVMLCTPTVSSTIGLEGLDLLAGQDVLVADDPISFARSIEKLCQDQALWESVAHSGRARIAAVHGRPAVAAAFRQAIENTLHSSPRGLKTDGRSPELQVGAPEQPAGSNGTVSSAAPLPLVIPSLYGARLKEAENLMREVAWARSRITEMESTRWWKMGRYYWELHSRFTGLFRGLTASRREAASKASTPRGEPQNGRGV